MKKLLVLSLFTLFFAGTVITAAAAIKKSNLRILYVGGSSDWSPKKFMNSPNPEEAYRTSVKERTEAFEKMLKTYFTNVTVINANDYTQQLSDNYDVTIMDGKPKEIAPLFQDAEKRIYMKPAYFTADFNKPILTIGQLSDDLGRRVGTKNDWYCLCLDADAHSWRKDHPIFKGPFEVKMTVVNKPTPEEAFHNDFEGKLPKEVPMWKVQTKGYATDDNFAIGLVSRPWGYEDSPEAEIISGGVSSKSIDAVAIARHGNWFHWGFAASPLYMTDEAQTVLANAIVYIAKFAGQTPIARKYNEGIATRETIDELKFMSSEKGYRQLLEMEESANKALLAMGEKAKAKKERGEKLDGMDEYVLNFVPKEPRSRESMLKLMMPDFYAMFGMDEQAYAKYFDENRNYFYAEGYHGLAVDEDAKSLGIDNHDIRLLDEAIKMLETKRDTDKAKRILAHYTLADFPTATQWRSWFEKNKKNMFFTESGGWIWLINSREPGVNDYRVWESRRALASVKLGETSMNDPIALNATLETLQSGEKALYITIKIHPGYHVYDRVSSSDPYLATKIEITVPEGYKKVGTLQIPASKAYNQKGTTVFEDTVVFSQIITGTGKGTVNCTVNYQSCDNNICFPPAEKTFSLPVN